MGRAASGVTGARFKRDGDEVVSMIVVPEGQNEQFQVLTACVNGYGKRTPLPEYPVKGRGTRGVINIDANDRNGEVVGMKLVVGTDEVMFITQNGILMRTRVSEIRETGRNAAGVRLIKIDEGDRLVAMAKIDADPEKPATDGTTGTGGDGATGIADDGAASISGDGSTGSDGTGPATPTADGDTPTQPE
jgi:DNA gyrase subunit A